MLFQRDETRDYRDFKTSEHPWHPAPSRVLPEVICHTSWDVNDPVIERNVDFFVCALVVDWLKISDLILSDEPLVLGMELGTSGVSYRDFRCKH